MFGGMVVATVLGVLLTPALYRMIQGVSETLSGRRAEAEPEIEAEDEPEIEPEDRPEIDLSDLD